MLEPCGHDSNESGSRMNWTIGLLSLGAVILGTTLDRRRQRERQRLPRQDIHRWEDEGGAVPVSPIRTAAQTEH